MYPWPQSLRSISVFATLSDETLKRVGELVITHSFAPGETIIYAGDRCEAVYFIAAGEVKIYQLSIEGREQVLVRLRAGQMFNAVPAFRDCSVNHATVEALTPVKLYAITCDDFLRLVNESHELALALLRDFAIRLDHMAGLVEDLALRTVRARLARFLLEHAGDRNAPGRWTQAEIAAHIGTVRDVVGRILRDFAGAGLVRQERQRIILLDRHGLELEAGL